MVQTQRQKIPLAKKDKFWRESNVQYYKQMCYVHNLYIQTLYRAANGELEATDYDYMVNPYGNAVANRPNLQSYPAKLRNYPIIPEIINSIFGEKRDRPILSYVSILNSDAMSIKAAEEIRILKQQLEQIYINQLHELGIDPGKDPKPVDPIEQILHQFNETYSDARAILGQEILDYLMMDCDVPEKFIQGFKHWVITSCVYTLKDVVNEDVVYRILNPQSVGFLGDDSTDYIEDCEGACVVENITRATFLDRYYSIIQSEGDELYNEILEYIDNPNKNTHDPRVKIYGYTDIMDGGTIYNGPYNNSNEDGNWYAWQGETLELAYVNWRSMRLKRVISFTNELGEPQELEVPEDYKVQEEFGEFIISEEWVSEAWEGYSLDNDKIFFGIRPIPIQRNRINNKSACKFLINGKIKKIGNRKQLSYIELLLPFQHLTNFGHYKINNILAKNKDKLLVMPIGILPNQNGWDMYTSMYHVDATSILWVDESNDATKQALNAIKSIDMGLGNYIESMFNYLDRIKAQAYAVVGMTPQRVGNMSKSEGLGVSDSAIRQSAVISEDLFAEYDKFQEKELTGLLDISKFAYLSGKKASYINSVGRQVFLEIDAENSNFVNADFQCFVVNSAKEKRKFDKMVSMAETLASQNHKGSYLATILNAETNFANLVNELESLEQKEQELIQQQKQQEQDSQKYISDQRNKEHQEDINLKYYEIDTKNDTAKEIALIDADVKTMGMDLNANAIPDSVEIEKNAINRDKIFADQSIKQREHSFKQEELRIKEKEINTRSSTEKYKADIDLKIAKENKTAAEIKARKINKKQ